MITQARSILPIGIMTAIGCGDRAYGTAATIPAATPPAPAVATGTIRGTVDLAAGTLTLDPVPSSLASLGSRGGVSAAIYGDQGVTVRFYNSAVTTGAPVAGKKTLSANVGIRNLLPHSIGDEQAGVAPPDTIGIYAFVNSGPTVVSTTTPCSPACTVTVQNQHGTRAFTAPAQSYWHWPERLGAAGSLTDTTLFRKAWVFQADTQVRIFSFDILVSATWPPTNESRWTLEYAGDSTPHLAAEPRWRRNAGSLGTDTLNKPTPGIITLNTPAGSSQYFTRFDSIGTTSNAYMEARVRTNSATAAPEIAFALDDNTRLIGVGLSGTSVGFLNAAFAFLGTSFVTTTTTLHTYQIRKFGADSVQLWMDGTWLDSRTYTSFPVSIATLSYFIGFGGPGTGANPISPGGNSSSWDYVIFEKGVTQP